jgi:hypothetical protein
VAERLEAAVEAVGWGGPPLLIGIGDDDVGTGGTRPLSPVGPATDDPVADLLGYVVPADCSGLAVVAEGTGRRLVGPGGDPWSEPVSSTPHRFAYVVDRDGRAAVAVRARGENAVVEARADGAVSGPGGRLVDGCHRAMGLATGPPVHDSARLWLLAWLDLLLTRALGRGAPSTWSDVVRLHPAVRLVERVDGPLPAGIDVAPEALGRMGRALGAARDWEGLRSSAARGEWAAPGVIPRHAAWMDAGMFARWVSGEFLPESVYLSELAEALPADVARRLRVVADAATS